MMMMIII